MLIFEVYKLILLYRWWFFGIENKQNKQWTEIINYKYLNALRRNQLHIRSDDSTIHLIDYWDLRHSVQDEYSWDNPDLKINLNLNWSEHQYTSTTQQFNF